MLYSFQCFQQICGRTKNETEAKTKLSEAVEQIKTRDYGNILPKKAELIRIAAVFNADPKVRAFTEFQLV